jgi:hypothetical protein
MCFIALRAGVGKMRLMHKMPGQNLYDCSARLMYEALFQALPCGAKFTYYQIAAQYHQIEKKSYYVIKIKFFIEKIR